MIFDSINQPLDKSKTPISNLNINKKNTASLFGIDSKPIRVDNGANKWRKNIIIEGILHKEESLQGSVILKIKGQKQKVYSFGDNLPFGGVIKEIHQNKVVIVKQDQKFIFYLQGYVVN